VCLSLVVLFVGILSSSSIRGADFLRGDADASGRLDVTDAIRVLDYLFRGAGDALTCKDAADVNDNGQIELSDAIFVLHSLFQNGGTPAAPFPFCGPDPTDDTLDCASWTECPPVLEYFGIEFQAGFVGFVIDRSGSQADRGELTRTKSVTIATIGTLPDGVQFGLSFVAGNRLTFPQDGAPATASPETRAAAIDFIESISGGVGQCATPGFLDVIEMAHGATTRAKEIFYVGDGSGTCPGQDEVFYLTEMERIVTAANDGFARIDTITTLPTGSLQMSHLQQLASENGGSYYEILH
jgi:hypothetical protein